MNLGEYRRDELDELLEELDDLLGRIRRIQQSRSLGRRHPRIEIPEALEEVRRLELAELAAADAEVFGE